MFMPDMTPLLTPASSPMDLEISDFLVTTSLPANFTFVGGFLSLIDHAGVGVGNGHRRRRRRRCQAGIGHGKTVTPALWSMPEI